MPPSTAPGRAARELLRRHGLPVVRLELLKGQPSRVYRARAATGPWYVVRFRADPLTPAAARVQHRWLEAIARDTDVVAPRSVPLGGARFRPVQFPGEAGPRQAAVFTWVAGRRARGAETFVQPAKLDALGAAAAALHRHAEGFGDRGIRACRRLDAAYFLGDPSCVGPAGRERLEPDHFAVLRAIADRMAATIEELGPSRRHFGLIHGDLEPPNWVFHGRAARPIDFEQFGVGYYLYDLAQVLWTHAMWPKYEAYRARLLAAYERVRPLDPVERRHLRTFEAIPLFEWVSRKLRADSPAVRDELRRWLPPTIEWLRASLGRREDVDVTPAGGRRQLRRARPRPRTGPRPARRRA